MAYAWTETHPKMTQWIAERGWIDVGTDEHSRSLVRCLDEGGTI